MIRSETKRQPVESVTEKLKNVAKLPVADTRAALALQPAP
jgi:hypothetical protein